MEPNIPPVQIQQPTTQPFKQVSNNKILIYIIIAVISAAISGVGVWYFMNQQDANDKKILTSQITTKDTTIAELQKTISTATLTPTATIPNNLESLKTFCAEDGKYNVSNYYFASVSNGLYGGCNVGPADGNIGGFYKITKIVDNTWTLITAAQQSTKAYLEENAIPLNVVISPNAYNLLP